uniref:Uncharacterized protein n=1 Tax=Onchocerca volvulus TaxID=6282 RepID=A0A8R1TVL1_ONCVO
MDRTSREVWTMKKKSEYFPGTIEIAFKYSSAMIKAGLLEIVCLQNKVKRNNSMEKSALASGSGGMWKRTAGT